MFGDKISRIKHNTKKVNGFVLDLVVQLQNARSDAKRNIAEASAVINDMNKVVKRNTETVKYVAKILGE